MRASCEWARFFVKCSLPLSLLMLAIGCGKKEGTLSGKVYYKGQVLKAGTINFFPEAKPGSTTSRLGSEIKEDGSYFVSKLPPGKAKVSIEVSNPAPPMAAMPRGPGGGGKAMQGLKNQQEKMKSESKGGKGPQSGPVEKVNLPDKYSDPETSGLSVDVTGGKQNQDIKIPD